MNSEGFVDIGVGFFCSLSLSDQVLSVTHLMSNGYWSFFAMYMWAEHANIHFSSFIVVHCRNLECIELTSMLPVCSQCMVQIGSPLQKELSWISLCLKVCVFVVIRISFGHFVSITLTQHPSQGMILLRPMEITSW
jgi:hypothetical protein